MFKKSQKREKKGSGPRPEQRGRQPQLEAGGTNSYYEAQKGTKNSREGQNVSQPQKKRRKKGNQKSPVKQQPAKKQAKKEKSMNASRAKRSRVKSRTRPVVTKVGCRSAAHQKRQLPDLKDEANP